MDGLLSSNTRTLGTLMTNLMQLATPIADYGADEPEVVRYRAEGPTARSR